MKTEFLSEGEILDRLKIAIKAAKQRVFGAVAYWGKGATSSLCLDATKAKSIHLIANAYCDGTNPDEILRLRKNVKPAQIRDLDSLHSKIWIIDDVAFVGSANASTSAIGSNEERSKLNEAVLVTTDGAVVEKVTAWFERMWANSTPADLDRLKSLSITRKAKPPPKPTKIRGRLELQTLSKVISMRSEIELESLAIDVAWGPYWKGTEEKEVTVAMDKIFRLIHADDYWFTDSDWPGADHNPNRFFIAVNWKAEHHDYNSVKASYNSAKARKLTPTPNAKGGLEVANVFMREIRRENPPSSKDKIDDICFFLEEFATIPDPASPRRITIDEKFLDEFRSKLKGCLKNLAHNSPHDDFFWGGVMSLPKFLKLIGYRLSR